MVERRRKRFGAGAVAHIHADDIAAGLPELVGVADDVLRVGRAFEAMHDDGCGAGGANRFRLPMAVAEDLARDLMLGGWGDFDELRFGWREAVCTWKIVAEDGLQVTIAHKASRGEISRLRGAGFKGGGSH